LSEALAQAEEEVVRGSLDVLERDARAAALERPDDVEARYRLAAVIGASLEHRSGGSKVSAAKEVHALVVRVLEDAPGHAGARYILGRLHAGVLRLDRVSRFVATRLLGGGALRSASWEEARTLLELSEREDPCVAEHHLELARVYAERGDSAGAARELAHVLEVTRGARGATGPSGSVPSSSAERGVRGSGDRARQQEIPQRRLRHQDARVRGRRRAPWIPRPAGSGIQEVEVTGGGPVSTRTSRVPGGPPLQAG
jgi:hypothetical protein